MNASTAEKVSLLRDAAEAATRVFMTLVTHGPISRIDVSRATELSQAAVTKAVAPMVAAGLVTDRVDAPRPAGRGRPANPLAVVPDALLLVGLKVNSDEVVGVVTDLANDVVASARLSLPSPDVDTTVETLRAAHAALIGDLGENAERVTGVGIGISGDVDAEAGVVRESALMQWAEPVPIAALLSDLAVPITLSNDVHALTTGEHWFGVGVGTESFAIVTIGRGIGAGLHLNGEVVEGAQGVAGEIGHLPLSSPDRVCACGRRGCVEAVASISAILADVEAVVGAPVDVDAAVALARGGNAAVASVFAAAGAAVGKAIASLVNLTGPEVVLIGGEGVAHFDLLEAELLKAFREHAFGAAVTCRIEVRSHTFEDWARGAAVAALQRSIR